MELCTHGFLSFLTSLTALGGALPQDFVDLSLGPDPGHGRIQAMRHAKLLHQGPLKNPF